MNPVERVIRKVDTAQQRNTPSAFVFGVIKKYGDDNGGTLAASLAHSAFVAVFPLLLVLVTVLGLIASGNQGLRQDVLNAAAKQFPMIGDQLVGNVHALRHSSAIGLVVGLLGLIWGATGLAQAGLFTMEQVWNLPGPARPGYLRPPGHGNRPAGGRARCRGEDRAVPRQLPRPHPQGRAEPGPVPRRSGRRGGLDAVAGDQHLPRPPLPSRRFGL